MGWHQPRGETRETNSDIDKKAIAGTHNHAFPHDPLEVPDGVAVLQGDLLVPARQYRVDKDGCEGIDRLRNDRGEKPIIASGERTQADDHCITSKFHEKHTASREWA
jgi:hypothetical protein